MVNDVKVQLRGKARELAYIMYCRKKYLTLTCLIILICLKIILENITLSGRDNVDLHL